jgi:hypothetical protein
MTTSAAQHDVASDLAATSGTPAVTETGATRNRILQAQAEGTLRVIRYEHGGGRVYIDGPRRELICDLYNEDTRELILTLMGVEK